MSKSTNDIIRSTCVITIALAGLVHLLIAPAHYAHAPAHGIFFAGAGLVQCAWAVAFWSRPTLVLYRVGLAVSGGLIVLWLLTLALPAPFGGHETGSIDSSAIVCKISELVGLIALVALGAQGGQLATDRKLPSFRLTSEALLVSLSVGVGLFGLGQAADPWLPQWQEGIEHVREESEHKAEQGEHDHAAEQGDHDRAEK